MRVAILQYSPRLGELSDNIARADKILRSSLATPPKSSTAAATGATGATVATVAAPPSVASRPATEIDLLVLPELAFSGYNFPSLSAIRPYLEPTAAGPSTQWAKRVAHEYGCVVTVGYPELFTHHPGQDHDTNNLVNGFVHIGSGSNSNGIDKHHASSTSGEEGSNGHSAGDTNIVAYNSLVTVSPTGDIIAHYRKTHLYYTDETWAQESPQGFFTTELTVPPFPRSTNPSATKIKSVPPTATTKGTPTSSALTDSPAFPPNQPTPTPIPQRTKIAWGICMDINPYRFLPHNYPLHEYATHARDHGANMCVLSMAWLSSLSTEDLASAPAEPDWNTFVYWIDRLTPLVLASADADTEADADANARQSESHAAAGGGTSRATATGTTHHQQQQQRERMTTVIFANRTGSEPGANPCGQGEAGVRYAGSSWIGRVGAGGRVEVWGMLGRGEEGVLRVDFSDDDTGPEKFFVLQQRSEGEGEGAEGGEGEE